MLDGRVDLFLRRLPGADACRLGVGETHPSARQDVRSHRLLDTLAVFSGFFEEGFFRSADVLVRHHIFALDRVVVVAQPIKE